MTIPYVPADSRIARYFAFGSNMNPARVCARGLRYRGIAGAWVHGLCLAFDKRAPNQNSGGHASVARAPGAIVEGLLYTLECPSEIRKMDHFERAPIHYSREAVWVMTDEGERIAWTYFANPAVLVRGARPGRAYLEHLLAGRPWLSAGYYRWLAAWPCEALAE